MILEKLTIHNFGIYGERQEIDLSPSEGRPVVLIGALNGGGKTTLLEALQIVLYGKAARCVDKRKGGYLEYLQRAVNRAAISKSASIELAFTYRSSGRDHRFVVTRTWSIHGAGVDEKLDVLKDGEFDLVTAERWSEFVEALIPSQISDLFFFDGERIESLADPERSADLIRIGVHSLLGLDLVDDLSKSLTVLERRMRGAKGSDQDRTRLHALEQRLSAARALEAEEFQRIASTRSELDQVQAKLRHVRDRFVTEGGALYDQREELAKQRDAVKKSIELVRSQLRDAAAGIAPLVLVLPRLMSARADAYRERDQHRAGLVAEALAGYERSVVERLHRGGLDDKTLALITAVLQDVRIESFSTDYTDRGLGVDPQAFEVVIPQLEAHRRVLIALFKELGPQYDELDQLDRKLSAVPDESKIAPVIRELNALGSREQSVLVETRVREEELQRLARERADVEQQLQRLEAELVGLQFEEQLQENMHRQLVRSKEILSAFRTRMRAKHVGRLEELVTDSFARLLRKQKFVERIRIDPETFDLSVHTVSGGVVPAERLSAGERQLLAVAILWALARASGRRLPAIVDTPLGRLDSKHRRHLVENYFPYASHQVVLLSTDEEIVARYHRSLKPAIAREYLVQYDEIARTSRVTEGYFQDLAEAA